MSGQGKGSGVSELADFNPANWGCVLSRPSACRIDPQDRDFTDQVYRQEDRNWEVENTKSGNFRGFGKRVRVGTELAVKFSETLSQH